MPESETKQGYVSALHKELSNLHHMHTFSPVSSTESVPKYKIGHSKLIFNKKFNADGSFNKYKCRLVFLGDRWIDYYNNKTYAGTVMSESINLLFSIVAERNMEFIVADCRTAFLHSSVPSNQDIYMTRPSGLDDTHMPPLVKLHKCLYGLPMAPAQFRDHNHKVLTALGFRPLVSDPRVYRRCYDNGEEAIIMVHVDDMGIATTSVALQNQILEQLSHTYTLELKSDEYLGMSIIRDRDTKSITLLQKAYVEELSDRFNMDKPSSYPLTPMVEPSNPADEPLLPDDITLYQAKVGALLYVATHTRPDILYAINIASRHSKSPSTADMAAVDRIIHYLMGTSHLGLHLHSDEGIVLSATVDASYACHADRKSHSGFTLHIGSSSGSFLTKSKKQTVTADSSTIAELIAAFLASKEIAWARSILTELGYQQDHPTILHEDNQSTIQMINNDSNSQKTKHIDVRYNYVREKVAAGDIVMKYCMSSDMTSDILTKPLAPKPFLHLRPKLLGMSVVTDLYLDLGTFKG
jgi:hypothetical protein